MISVISVGTGGILFAGYKGATSASKKNMMLPKVLYGCAKMCVGFSVLRFIGSL